MTTVPTPERLPCGCQIGSGVLEDGRRTFAIRPCKLTCENYKYAVAATRRQGKPVEYYPDTEE